MKKILALACVLGLAAVSNSALAADGQGFLRAEIGNTNVDTEVTYFGQRFSGSTDDTSVGFGGGYWFTKNIGVEGNYTLLANKTDEETDTDIDLYSIGVGVVAKKNFGADDQGFFIGGRAGVARMTVQTRESGTFDVDYDDSSTKAYYGVNIGYDFNESWGLSLNYDRRQADLDAVEVDTDTVSIGGEWRF